MDQSILSDVAIPPAKRGLKVGTTLNGELQDYRVISYLSSGGQADMYRVVTKPTDPSMPIRVYAAKWYRNRADALNERSILSQVVHPNILRMRDQATPNDEQEVNIFDWYDSSLAHQMMSDKKPEPQQILECIAGITSALEHLHQKSILHCDVKPSNILVNSSSEAYILSDFGTARLLGNGSNEMLAYVAGTIPYRSPEQDLHLSLTPASDQYSFALIAAELLLGQKLLTSMFRTDEDKIDYQRLLSVFDTTAYGSVFQRALAIEPKDRHKTIWEFSEELLTVLHNEEWIPNTRSTIHEHPTELVQANPFSSKTKSPSQNHEGNMDLTPPVISIAGKDFEYEEITQFYSIDQATPDELTKYREELLGQIEDYSEKTVVLFMYKSKLQEECLGRLQQARMRLFDSSIRESKDFNPDLLRARILEIMHEVRLIHVIIAREQKTQTGEQAWRWIVPFLTLAYIVAIVLSVIYGQVFFSNDMTIPLVGVPVSVILWASIGSLAAILYRFYTRQPGRLADEVRWLVARPIIGIIMGSLGYLTVLSGMFAFGGTSAVNAAFADRPELLWLLAFLGGFSDRFFESVLNGVIGRLSNENK